MKPFYKKASKETIDKRREDFLEKYNKEIDWLRENLGTFKEQGDDFLLDMYAVLITGNRPFSEKMHNAVIKSMKNPMFDPIERIKRKEKMKPILEKINRVWELVAEVDGGKADYYLANWSALPFVDSIMKQANKNGKLSEKQLLALNKVYKKYLKRKDKKDNKDV